MLMCVHPVKTPISVEAWSEGCPTRSALARPLLCCFVLVVLCDASVAGLNVRRNHYIVLAGRKQKSAIHFLSVDLGVFLFLKQVLSGDPSVCLQTDFLLVNWACLLAVN